MAELQKSLHTKDLGEARRRCHEATAWFKAAMEALRRMAQPTRADLERAATLFFERLKADVDQPRRFGSRPLHEAVAEQVDLSEARIRELDHQLVTNEYDVTTDRLAADMLTAIHNALPSLDDASALQARSLAARAAREQMLYFLHQLSAVDGRAKGTP